MVWTSIWKPLWEVKQLLCRERTMSCLSPHGFQTISSDFMVLGRTWSVACRLLRAMPCPFESVRFGFEACWIWHAVSRVHAGFGGQSKVSTLFGRLLIGSPIVWGHGLYERGHFAFRSSEGRSTAPAALFDMYQRTASVPLGRLPPFQPEKPLDPVDVKGRDQQGRPRLLHHAANLPTTPPHGTGGMAVAGGVLVHFAAVHVETDEFIGRKFQVAE